MHRVKIAFSLMPVLFIYTIFVSCAVEKRQLNYISLSNVEQGEQNVLIELSNSKPIRGIQFTISSDDDACLVALSKVRTTPRTKGFLATFNKESKKVILINPSGGSIAPGNGPIVEIVLDFSGEVGEKKCKFSLSNQLVTG